MRLRPSTLVGAALVLLAQTAFADDAPGPPAPAPPAPSPLSLPPAEPRSDQLVSRKPPDAVAELAAMRALMLQFEDPARVYRLAGGLTSLALGVVTVPLAAVMLERGAQTEVGPVFLLGIGLGETISGIFILATPTGSASGYGPVTERIAAGQHAGESAEKTVAAAAEVWHDRAVVARDGRHAIAGFAFAIGAVATGIGVGLDVAQPLASLTRTDQDAGAAGAFGLGYVGLTTGVQALVFPTPVEVSWRAYTAGRSVAAASPAQVALGGLRPVRLPGGYGLGWGSSF